MAALCLAHAASMFVICIRDMYTSLMAHAATSSITGSSTGTGKVFYTAGACNVQVQIPPCHDLQACPYANEI